MRSPEFAVSRTAFRAVPPLLLGFVRLQRCGWNPVTHATCHDGDAVDAETGRVVDLRGGWHDAGDRIKHCITTSYCVAGLALAGALDEAQHGAEFVAKIHPDAETLYVQVGDDRDHGGGWTAWHDDRTDYGSGPGGRRAAWPATGHPAGPRFRNASTGLASLAGRCAAALALAGGDLAQARSLYALAKAHPGYAQSVPVKAPYAYVEATWYDDLEWAATELYRTKYAAREMRLRFDVVAIQENANGERSLEHIEGAFTG